MHKKVQDSLSRIDLITSELVKRYGIKAVFNTNNVIHQDRIYAMGLILQLEDVIDKAPSPVTISKHLAHIEALVEQMRS